MSSHDVPKYRVPVTVELSERRWPSVVLDRSPQWCSIDLRDGNQALPNPMTPAQKLEYFKMLVRIGFKDIEVAYPSASEDDFRFVRTLVEGDHIPDDVFVMGLVACKDKLIDRTFESFAGAPRAIVHLYVATSELHMKQVFGFSRQQVLDMVRQSVERIRTLAEAMPESDIRFQFSPEEFTDTDPEFALEVCRVAYDTWGRATVDKPVILNLPATVERRPPGQYADLIEWFCARFPERDKVTISLHAHNDQGMAVAATELALAAGADRVEGALFGHGERAGNVDIVTIACNLFSRGIDTGLDFSDLPHIAETVQRLTGMPVYYRQPYSGEYVFTAFSGTHQDAIRKGMRKLGEAPALFGMGWKVPYLHVDPSDLGRRFERLIRINSQSGKGGIAWVLEQDYGFDVPKAMQPEIGAAVQSYADEAARELTGGEVYEVFEREFLKPVGRYELVNYWPRPDQDNPGNIHGEVRLRIDGIEKQATAEGNGPVSALVAALGKLGVEHFAIDDYKEQALGKGAEARACCYVPLHFDDGTVVFGTGIDTNIDQAAARAVICGLNRHGNGKK